MQNLSKILFGFLSLASIANAEIKFERLTLKDSYDEQRGHFKWANVGFGEKTLTIVDGGDFLFEDSEDGEQDEEERVAFDGLSNQYSYKDPCNLNIELVLRSTNETHFHKIFDINIKKKTIHPFSNQSRSLISTSRGSVQYAPIVSVGGIDLRALLLKRLRQYQSIYREIAQWNPMRYHRKCSTEKEREIARRENDASFSKNLLKYAVSGNWLSHNSRSAEIISSYNNLSHIDLQRIIYIDENQIVEAGKKTFILGLGVDLKTDKHCFWSLELSGEDSIDLMLKEKVDYLTSLRNSEKVKLSSKRPEKGRMHPLAEYSKIVDQNKKEQPGAQAEETTVQGAKRKRTEYEEPVDNEEESSTDFSNRNKESFIESLLCDETL